MELEAKQQQKTCIGCGVLITRPGRSDTKYCTPECKTAYNNRKEDVKELTVPAYIKKVKAILENNRKILDDLLGPTRDKWTFQTRDVIGRGFNFKYFTSRAPTKDKTIYCFCFEMGYLEFDDDTILVVRREREIIC